jgi:hypothetical protein
MSSDAQRRLLELACSQGGFFQCCPSGCVWAQLLQPQLLRPARTLAAPASWSEPYRKLAKDCKIDLSLGDAFILVRNFLRDNIFTQAR